ncbi:MAG: hypothetical protein ABIZ50_01315 [Solirubrobacterales bacterium]
MISAILAAALMIPAAASAQSPPVGGYGGSGGNVQNVLTGGSTGSDSATSSSDTSASTGTLPFTGLDIGWMIGGGILLVGAGIAMSRAAHRAPETR